jgi:hypothetical protein
MAYDICRNCRDELIIEAEKPSKRLRKRKQLTPERRLLIRLCKKYFAPDYKPE